MIQHAMSANDVPRMPADLLPLPALRGWRLDVVKQLLGDLDTVTAAGQRFTMQKVVGLLRQEIGWAEAALTELQRRAVARALDDLGREQDRPLPNTDAFVMRTQLITDTLALL